jgi:hypothetical protein
MDVTRSQSSQGLLHRLAPAVCQLEAAFPIHPSHRNPQAVQADPANAQAP